MAVEVLTDSDPVARKRHRCIWCGEFIDVGETYHRQSGIFDREPYVNKLHQECWGGMQELHRIDRFAVEDGFEAHGFKRGTTDAR